MMKCQFCQYENEDGALFCEQCKSDLGSAPIEVVGTPIAEPIPLADMVEAVPVVAEASPAAAALVAEAAIIAPATPIAESVHTAPAAPAVVAPATPAPTADDENKLPPGAQPKLVVLRGLKINVEYPIYEGHNFIGRADEKPVDIDLEDQEPPDRIWSSRQHAFIAFEDGALIIEDLNSSNGTFVNRSRIYPGQKCPLKINDVIQIGTVQMKVKI